MDWPGILLAGSSSLPAETKLAGIIIARQKDNGLFITLVPKVFLITLSY